MNLLLAMVIFFIFASMLPPPIDSSDSRISVRNTTYISKQEPTTEPIRHGKKRRKHKTGTGSGKKRRRLKTSSSRRFVEKQYLVHNRTLALLGDDVQKILLNTRTLTIKLPYPEGNATDFSVRGRKAKSRSKAVGESRLKKVVGSSGVLIGLRLSRERDSSRSSRPGSGRRNKANGRRRPSNSSTVATSRRTEYDYDLDERSFNDESRVNFGTALARLISAVSNLPAVQHHPSATPCDKLLDCKKNMEDIFLGPLPACPCIYPAEIFYEDKLWDEHQKRFYRWRDASGESERLDVYKRGAVYCIRSLLANGSTSLASQQCCYDRDRKLITRGSGAGTPNYVSPDVSRRLHEKIDVLPWKLCNGDFTKYNKMRPPNNGNRCEENPENNIYEKQVKLTKFY